MNSSPPRVFIGTSGYQYDHWAGIFYPEDLPRKQWFEFYTQHFDTVEINNTFYGLPQAAVFDDWRRRAPDGFCFVLKFSRYGSHLKKLKDPHTTVAAFMERAERLGPLLGPILVQLPPHWAADPDRLDAFLHASAKGQRWAFEFRDPSWLSQPVYDVLRAHNAALCIHDLIVPHPYVITADWVYLRFHGAGATGNYSPEALAAAAQRIKQHTADGLDVYAFFNNDVEGYAAANAADLKQLVFEQ